eukprot:gb/GECG01014280.1/.p1 GENE.gb/GECG01014280.1/~~gb/GECG01014280.1/.p1  ORF type:complete len:1299 (+),score=198.00 gb/GECG01014280.1/:1-3897(+)
MTEANGGGGGSVYSPRTAFHHELLAFSYEVVDLVLNIYDNRLEEIKDIFQQHGGQLTREEFTKVVLRLLGPNAEVKVRVPPSYGATMRPGATVRRATTAASSSLDEEETWGEETVTPAGSRAGATSKVAGRTLRSTSSSSSRTRTRGDTERKGRGGGESTVPSFQRQVLDEETLRYRLMALFDELDVTKAGIVTWNQYATFCMHLSEVVVDPQFIHSLEAYQRYNPEEEGVEEEWVESESSSDEEEPATKQARLTRRLQQIFNNQASTSNVSQSLTSNDFSHIVEKKINETMNDPEKKKEKKRLQRKMASQTTETKSSSQAKVRSSIELIQYIPVIDAIATVEAKGSGVQLLKADNLAHLGTLKDSTATAGGKSDYNVVEAIECFASPHSFSKPYLLTASANSTITLWDIQLGSRMGTKMTSWPTGSSQQCMKFIDRYSILYSGSSLGSLHSWNIRDACEVSSVSMHDDIITKIVDIPAQDALATASHDKTAKIFDLATSSEVLKFTGHRRGVVDVDYQDSYRVLLTASYDHECGVYSPLTPKRLHTLGGHDMPLIAARGIPNSSEILTASIDGKVKIWDLRQPTKPVYNMSVTEDEITGQSTKASKTFLRSFDICHPVRPQFMCAFKDIYLYRKLESKEMKHKAHRDSVTGIGYDSKHGSILTSSGCSVYTWSMLTGKLQREFRDIAKSSISCMLVDSTSGLFFLGTELGSIQLHGTLTGHMLHRLSGHTGEVVSLEFYGNDLVSVGKDKQVLHHRTVNALHSREAPKAITVSRGSGAKVFTSPSSQLPGNQELKASTSGVAGRGRETIRDKHSRRMPQSETDSRSASTGAHSTWAVGHSDDITCLDCYSLSGLIVTGGKDRMIYVWQAATGHVVAKEMLDSPISRVKFLRGESILVTADEGGAVILWKLQITSSSLSPIAAFHHTPTSFQHHMGSEEVEDLLESAMQQQTSQNNRRNRPASTPTQSSPTGSDTAGWKVHNSSSGRASSFEDSSESDTSGEFNQPPVVSSILYDSNASRLYTGDDEGHICCWNLKNLLQAYEVFEIGETETVGGTRRIQRRHSLGMETGHRDSILRFTHKAKTLTALLPEVQFMNQPLNKKKQLWLSMQAELPNHVDPPIVSAPALVTLDWHLSAHSEAVQVLTIASNPGVPETIVSGGFDGHVIGTRLAEGTLVGKLVGVVNESRNPAWDLEIDTETLRAHLTQAGPQYETHSKFGYEIEEEEPLPKADDEESVSSTEAASRSRISRKTPEVPFDSSLRFSQQELCPPKTKQRVSSALQQMHEMLNSAQISNIKKK